MAEESNICDSALVLVHRSMQNKPLIHRSSLFLLRNGRQSTPEVTSMASKKKKTSSASIGIGAVFVFIVFVVVYWRIRKRRVRNESGIQNGAVDHAG